MKRILAFSITISASAGLLATPTFATTVDNNRGSIVKISNTCSDLANVASNNRGSIVKIDGGGQCDINEILNSSSVQNNRGSIIKIDNVCGNTDNVATNNRGSIIKINSTGPCDKTKPTTVTVTPAATAKESTPAATQMPAELPKTGTSSSLLASLAGLSVLGYVVARYLQSRSASFVK